MKDISQLECIFHLTSVLPHSLDDNLYIIIMVDNFVDYRAAIIYLSSQSSDSFNFTFLYLLYIIYGYYYIKEWLIILFMILMVLVLLNIEVQSISKWWNHSTISFLLFLFIIPISSFIILWSDYSSIYLCIIYLKSTSDSWIVMPYF